MVILAFFSFTNELFEFKLDQNCPLSNLFFWCGFEIQDACSCCTQFKKGAYWRKIFSVRIHYTTTVHELLDFLKANILAIDITFHLSMSSYANNFLTDTTESIWNKLVRNAILVDLIRICDFWADLATIANDVVWLAKHQSLYHLFFVSPV